MTVSRPGAILFGPYPDYLFLTVNCPGRARRVKPLQMTPMLSPKFQSPEMTPRLLLLRASL